jgi:hypothetical protein
MILPRIGGPSMISSCALSLLVAPERILKSLRASTSSTSLSLSPSAALRAENRRLRDQLAAGTKAADKRKAR